MASAEEIRKAFERQAPQLEITEEAAEFLTRLEAYQVYPSIKNILREANSEDRQQIDLDFLKDIGFD